MRLRNIDLQGAFCVLLVGGCGTADVDARDLAVRDMRDSKADMAIPRDLATRPDLTPEPPAVGYLAAVGATCTSRVDVAPLHGNGLVGQWKAQPEYPLNLGRPRLAVVGDCLFQVGGWICTDSMGHGKETDMVHAARLGAGAVGPWTPTTGLPAAAGGGLVVESGGFLIALPGRPEHGVLKAPVDGKACTVGKWETIAGPPTVPSSTRYVVTGGYVYQIAGAVASKASTVVAYAPLSGGELGEFVVASPLPVGRWSHAAVTDGTHLYVLGGRDDNGDVDTIFAARIRDDHSLDEWSSLPQRLPVSTFDFDALVTEGYLYIVPGVTPDYRSDVWSARIGNGVVGPFQKQTTLPTYRNGHRLARF